MAMKKGRNGKQLAKCRRIEISPQDAAINVGDSQIYTCEAFDKKGNSLGDITTLVQFTISQDAGGSWRGNIYTFENPGSWVVTAEFRRKTDRASLTVNEIPEPEPPVPEPPLPEPPPLPPPELDPIAGDVWHSMSPIGQCGNRVCFVYLKNSAAYLWLDGVSYLLPDSPVYHPYPYKVILTNYIWLIEQSDGIKVHQYQVTDGEVSLISTVILGDSNSVWGDVILLQSGKLVITWWQKPGVDITDIEIHFALGNEAGWSEINAIMPGSHLRQNKIALAQHPTDGAVWYFQTSDSRGVLKAMRLVENGDNLEVTLINPYFIPYSDNLRPEGEMPTVRAIADPSTNSILVAYQNKDFEAFSWVPPICKGANINVISVKSDGAISLRGVLEKWVERISNFSIGIAAGQFWLAFGEIDAETLKWNILKVYYEDGSEKYLGQLKAMGSSQGGLYMTNSSDWVIATMEDGYIHFFSVD